MIDARRLRRLADKVRPEYALGWTEDCEDREITDRVKWILENRLHKKDRDLLLLYADRQSVRDVTKEIGCSHTTVRDNVIRIRAQIMEELNKMTRK